MAATKRSKTYMIDESTGSFKDSNNIPASSARDMIFSVYEPQGICQGRLTLESGVAVSTSDQTAKTNVYFTPHLGNCIGIYDGTSWTLRTFSELTLALGTLTDAKNYDVFIYDNAGTLTLEALAWTSDTARATALALQDGVYSKTGALTRRYLGTFRTTATTTTEDSDAKRFVWNLYNQVPRRLYARDQTDHTYNGGYRQWRSQSANQIAYVCGLAGQVMPLEIFIEASTASGGYAIVANGLDSTSVVDVFAYVNVAAAVLAEGIANPTKTPALLGYHYIALLQSTATTGTANFGDGIISASILG